MAKFYRLFYRDSWVEEVEAGGGAGDGGVEPAVEVEALGFGGDAAHVDKDVAPLSAL